MPLIPTGFVSRDQLEDAVSRATHKLGNEVVRVRYNVGTDSGGDPAIYFRIVLPDSAIAEGTLADLTGRIADTLSDEVHPYENWGLIPYFNFRGSGEQGSRDPEWS